MVDKYKQGKVNSFRDYLVTALVKKIEELELRRMKDRANEKTIKDRAAAKQNELNKTEIKLKTCHFTMVKWLRC